MNQYNTEPYFIYLEAVPQSNNPQASELGGARVHAWVFETSKERALDKAVRYVQTYGWDVKEIVSVDVMLPQQLAQLGKQEAKNLHAAESLGINAHIQAYPLQDKPGEYSEEPLQKPPGK